MMDFVLMTLSFTVAILLASVISVFVVLNTKVMKWYVKKTKKVTMELFDESFDDLVFEDKETV